MAFWRYSCINEAKPGCPDVSGHPLAREYLVFSLSHTELLKTAPVSPGGSPFGGPFGVVQALFFSDHAAWHSGVQPTSAGRIAGSSCPACGRGPCGCNYVSYRAVGPPEADLTARSKISRRLVPIPSSRLADSHPSGLLATFRPDRNGGKAIPRWNQSLRSSGGPSSRLISDLSDFDREHPLQAARH